MTLTIEMLYPEVANLHGDNANIDYLAACRPDARIIRTPLSERPAFVDGAVELVYLGPLTERGQLRAIEHLRPHRDRIRARIEEGGAFLFTHNAMEVLGTRIRNDEMAYDVEALGLVEFETSLRMFERLNGKVMGVAPESGAEFPIVGYKSQFSTVHADDSLPGFLVAERGIGRSTATAVEGFRRGNFIGTSLIGPLLVTNPEFTRGLLRLLDQHTEPVLAHEELALSAYRERLRGFRDPARWHAAEKVRPAR